jgi:hypothetical protein
MGNKLEISTTKLRIWLSCIEKKRVMRARERPEFVRVSDVLGIIVELLRFSTQRTASPLLPRCSDAMHKAFEARRELPEPVAVSAIERSDGRPDGR